MKLYKNKENKLQEIIQRFIYNAAKDTNHELKTYINELKELVKENAIDCKDRK